MSVDVDSIKQSFPEFNLGIQDNDDDNIAQDVLIATKIDEAEGMIDRSIFQSPTNADSAVKYLTAHLLALAPSAVNLRLVKKDGSTLYYLTYERLTKRAAFGYRVP